MMSPGKYTATELATSDASREIALAESPRRFRGEKRSTDAADLACLVVSPDPLRRMMFGQTAERTGWRPLICTTFSVAVQHLTAGNVGAAVVDIASPAEHVVKDLRQLVECLAVHRDVLTVVCGRTNDRLAEIWARELGVWAHLPGVAPESDLDSLLRAARQVVDRMYERRGRNGADNPKTTNPR